MCRIGKDEPKVRIHGRNRDGVMRGDGGRKSGVNSESEVEAGGGRGEQERRAGEEREVCIHVAGNRGIYSSAHTSGQEERDG